LKMRKPHLECTNCDSVQHKTDLSEQECHPVTCAAPVATDVLEVTYNSDVAVDLNEFTTREAEVVPYKTQVSVRCAVGYELFKEGELVDGGDANEYLTLGHCMTNGLFGADPDHLHGAGGEAELAVALGSARYTCAKKPLFCPPLWEAERGEEAWAGAVAPFQQQNHMAFLRGIEYDADNNLGVFQKLQGSFVVNCATSHRVGDGLEAEMNCDGGIDCVDYDHEITVTCLEQEGNRLTGAYAFGAPAANVAFHHYKDAKDALAMCVPQVCEVPADLNPEAETDRSRALPRARVVSDWANDGPKILFNEKAVFACSAGQQLIERSVQIDSHVAGVDGQHQCMKDDSSNGEVTLTCRTGWLTQYEADHDPACYDHCGAPFAGREDMASFLTSVCHTTHGDAKRKECEDELARGYECDAVHGSRGYECRDAAMVSCAAVHHMADLDGQAGVGLKLGRSLDNHAFNLMCEPNDGAGEALFKYQKYSEESGLKNVLAPAASGALLGACGKQLRIVEESDEHHTVDACPRGDLESTEHGQACSSGPGKCMEAVAGADGKGDLVVTDCNAESVAQRFVYTTESSDSDSGSSGQLVSLLAPDKDQDGGRHLWCVQMQEKDVGNRRTRQMEYGLSWCATDVDEDANLYCSGDEGMPGCQAFRSNVHNFDGGAAEVEDEWGDEFWGDEEETLEPAANVFSYVQPGVFTIDIQDDWAAIRDGLTEPFEISDVEDKRKEGRGRGRGSFQGPASDATREGFEKLFASVHKSAKVVDIIMLSGRRDGARVTFDFRVQDLSSVDVTGFLEAITENGLPHAHRTSKTPPVACGENEQCSFLYFLRDHTVYDLNGTPTQRDIYSCSGEQACKYEMTFASSSPGQRVPVNAYHLCYSTDISECRH